MKLSTVSTFVSISMFVVLSSTPRAGAEPAATKPGLRHGVAARAISLTADGSVTIGAGVDWRVARGRSAIHLGLAAATAFAGDDHGFIRFEASYNFDLGPFYAGVGVGAGTQSIGTPGAGTGKWTGASTAPFVQLGRELAIGGRAIFVEARGGIAVPFGSIDPMEPVPPARAEVGAAAGVRF